jgi:hypothetical protein
VYGAAFALPAVGYILAPFLAGTKLPSRKAWFQSNLAWPSRAVRNFSRICSQTPWSCHSWSRRWQVDRLPYFGGKSFQRAPDRSTQRMPFKVRRPPDQGLPLLLCFGRSGAISSHCSSLNSSSIAPTSHPETGGEVRCNGCFFFNEVYLHEAIPKLLLKADTYVRSVAESEILGLVHLMRKICCRRFYDVRMGLQNAG